MVAQTQSIKTMKTLSKWYPIILTILGTIAVVTTFIVKCAAQEPTRKCNTVVKFVFYPMDKVGADTVYAVMYKPDSLTAVK
jgi:hypothetical protein